MRILRLSLILALLVVVAGCKKKAADETAATTEPAATTVDPAAEKDALRALTDDYNTAFNNKDAAAVAAMYLEDAMWFPADGPRIEGRAAIQEALQKRMDMADLQFHTQPEDFSVCSSGDMATGHGVFTQTGKTADGKAFNVKQQWAASFHKVDGKWMIGGVIWNGGGPAMEETAPVRGKTAAKAGSQGTASSASTGGGGR